ncbi:MAG: hypothetical protein DRI90_05395 [Deltaproteobacteria bacterium]|nr:MAG: hypothetical protein DRI90_05395 [Deltaproteobacteria bacterium]
MASQSPDELTLAELRRYSLAQLEELYAQPRPVTVPRGHYQGTHLQWLDTKGARHRLLWPVVDLLFRRTPFGVDFEKERWFFFRRGLGMGRFATQIGPSRWRDTETLRLTYDRSRLPWPLRPLLYDEVKPLSDSLCLGLGGINAESGRGEYFYFALQRCD